MSDHGDSTEHERSAAVGPEHHRGEPERLLAYLARGLVDSPEEVLVERFDEEAGTILLELSVAEDDYGKVIGRGGRTAKALRTVLRALAGQGSRRVIVDIVD